MAEIMMEKYRVGIIGCGRMGRGSIEDEVLEGGGMTLLPYSHAGAVKDLPRLELVAGADVSPEALADFTRRWGVKSTYKDYAEMLKKESLEVVCIATGTPAHYDAVMQSVKSGVKGIFCEKPISTTLEQADQIVDACTRKGVKLSINHTRRWDPYHRRAKELLEKGRIGEVISITGYIGEPMSFGGTHVADTFRLFAGEVDWVFGQVDKLTFADAEQNVFNDVERGAGAYVKFKSGARGFISQCDGFEWDLVCTRGRIKGGNIPFEMWETRKEEGGIPSVAKLWDLRTGVGRFPAAMRHTAPMVNALSELLDSIEQGKGISCDGIDGTAALEIITAINESSRRGEVTKLPLSNRKLGILSL